MSMTRWVPVIVGVGLLVLLTMAYQSTPDDEVVINRMKVFHVDYEGKRAMLGQALKDYALCLEEPSWLAERNDQGWTVTVRCPLDLALYCGECAAQSADYAGPPLPGTAGQMAMAFTLEPQAMHPFPAGIGALVTRPEQGEVFIPLEDIVLFALLDNKPLPGLCPALCAGNQ